MAALYHRRSPPSPPVGSTTENGYKKHHHTMQTNNNATPRRTFAEIINELSQNPVISAEFRLSEDWSDFGEDPAIFDTDYCGDEGWEPIVIHRNGKAELNITLTPAQLAAISAACTEIAAAQPSSKP